jgi:uncharacterized membrane protein
MQPDVRETRNPKEGRFITQWSLPVAPIAMRATTKSKLLKSIAALLAVVAVALAGLGFFLIKGGAYPAEGSGSLGHAGMVIAGAIAGFLAVVLGLFAVFCISRVRAIERAIRLENERRPAS